MAMSLGFLGRGKGQSIVAAVSLHIIGAALAGAVVGWALGAIGAGLALAIWRPAVIGTVAIFALWHGLTQYPRSLGLQRQVPRGWGRTMVPWLRFLLWGVLLGSGIAVLIPYSAYVVLLAAQLTAGAVLGAVSGAVFGVVRGAWAAGVVFVAREGTTRPEGLAMLFPAMTVRMRRFNVAWIVVGALLLMLGNRI